MAFGTSGTDLNPLHGAFEEVRLLTDAYRPCESQLQGWLPSSYRRTPPGQFLSAQPRQRGVHDLFFFFLTRASHDV